VKSRTLFLTRISLFAAFMAVSAHIRIPLGPVPLTMQSFTALVAGYCLGPLGGPAAMLLYTAVGLAGLPVFAAGGGPAYVLSPTFGYIVGFVFCAALVGFLARFNRGDSVVSAYLIMLAGLTLIYIPGLFWLAASLRWLAEEPSSVETLVRIGFLIPAAGDILTAIPAAGLSVRLRKVLS